MKINREKENHKKYLPLVEKVVEWLTIQTQVIMIEVI